MLLNLSYLNACVVNYSSEKAKQHEMLVLYDFTSRNGKELTVRKGDIVEASTRNPNRTTLVVFFFFTPMLLIIFIIIICSSSICSCWTRATSGGR